MKYISLFSGIGGFEQAIHEVFPDAECLGYSEIDPYVKIRVQKYSCFFSGSYFLGKDLQQDQKYIPKW